MPSAHRLLLSLCCAVTGSLAVHAQTVTATVGAGNGPYSVAVNPVTNKIYVANFFSANVTVIDGPTNSTTTVSTGINPHSIAVNPVTNKIKAANRSGGKVRRSRWATS